MKLYLNAAEVAEAVGVSKPTAYKIIMIVRISYKDSEKEKALKAVEALKRLGTVVSVGEQSGQHKKYYIKLL